MTLWHDTNPVVAHIHILQARGRMTFGVQWQYLYLHNRLDVRLDLCHDTNPAAAHIHIL